MTRPNSKSLLLNYTFCFLHLIVCVFLRPSCGVGYPRPVSVGVVLGGRGARGAMDPDAEPEPGNRGQPAKSAVDFFCSFFALPLDRETGEWHFSFRGGHLCAGGKPVRVET